MDPRSHHDVTPGANAIVVEQARTATAEVTALVTELEDELAANYPPEQRHGLSIEAIFQPHIRFFVAKLDGEAVGCGGVALFAEFAELKRMYVRRASRGLGVADAIIARLLNDAAGFGLTVVRLETGTEQAAAIRFYARHGFQPCDAFPPYSSMPPQAIATSVFLERRI